MKLQLNVMPFEYDEIKDIEASCWLDDGRFWEAEWVAAIKRRFGRGMPPEAFVVPIEVKVQYDVSNPKNDPWANRWVWKE